MSKLPVDIKIEQKEKVLKDEIFNCGKYKNGQSKLFSDIVNTDMEYCLSTINEFSNMRRFYNYVRHNERVQDALKHERNINKQKKKEKKEKKKTTPKKKV